MQTGADIITQVLVRNNRTTTDSFITDTMLNAWLNDAHVWAAGYHKWPFTENYTTLGTFGSEQYPYSSSLAANVKSDSIRYIATGDISDTSSLKRFRKVTLTEYLKYREDYTSGTDRIFSDFNRTAFVNPMARDASGSVYAFYQYLPSTINVESTSTIFTNYDPEGNEALVEKMTNYLKRREHLTEEAEIHDQRAVAKLDELWKVIQDEQAMYQAAPTSEGLFERMDVLGGGFRADIFKRDQFS